MILWRDKGRARRPAPTSSQLERLHFEILIESVLAQFSPVTGLLVASKGSERIKSSAVDIYLPRAQSSSYALGSLDIARPHTSRKPVNSVIGDSHRIVFVFVRNDRQHRAENLFASDGHFITHVREDRRPHEVTLLQSFGSFGAAGNERRTFFLALLDVAADSIALNFRYQRTKLCFAFARVADREALGCFFSDSHGFVVTFTRHKHTCESRTSLARVEVAVVHATSNGLLEVRV